MSSAGWKVAASLERTRKLASKIQNSPELLENMARELEELSLKYIKYEQMMRATSMKSSISLHGPVIVC